MYQNKLIQTNVGVDFANYFDEFEFDQNSLEFASFSALLDSVSTRILIWNGCVDLESALLDLLRNCNDPVRRRVLKCAMRSTVEQQWVAGRQLTTDEMVICLAEALASDNAAVVLHLLKVRL